MAVYRYVGVLIVKRSINGVVIISLSLPNCTHPHTSYCLDTVPLTLMAMATFTTVRASLNPGL